MPENLTTESRSEVIDRHRINDSDCGSPRVQIALLSKRINDLKAHFDTHPKDLHSHHGLLNMVSRRRRLLKYLKKTDFESYQSLIQSLGLRR